MGILGLSVSMETLWICQVFFAYIGHHCGPNCKKKTPTGKNTVSNNGVRFTFSYFKLVQSEHCIYWIECYDWSCFEYVNKPRALKFYDNKNLVSFPL